MWDSPSAPQALPDGAAEVPLHPPGPIPALPPHLQPHSRDLVLTADDKPHLCASNPRHLHSLPPPGKHLNNGLPGKTNPLVFHLASAQSSRSLPERAPRPQQQQSTETKERQPQNTYFTRIFFFFSPFLELQCPLAALWKPTRPSCRPTQSCSSSLAVNNPQHPSPGREGEGSALTPECHRGWGCSGTQQEGQFPPAWLLCELPCTPAQPCSCSSFPFHLHQMELSPTFPTELPTWECVHATGEAETALILTQKRSAEGNSPFCAPSLHLREQR